MSQTPEYLIVSLFSQPEFVREVTLFVAFFRGWQSTDIVLLPLEVSLKCEQIAMLAISTCTYYLHFRHKTMSM